MKTRSLNLFLLFTVVSLFFHSFNSFSQAISPKEFKEGMHGENVVLLDVRTPEEFSEEHIARAININVRFYNFKTRIDSLDKNKIYFIYCKAGKRSEEAIQKMREAGFKNLYYLKGGIDSWKEKGYKVEKE